MNFPRRVLQSDKRKEARFSANFETNFFGLNWDSGTDFLWSMTTLGSPSGFKAALLSRRHFAAEAENEFLDYIWWG